MQIIIALVAILLISVTGFFFINRDDVAAENPSQTRTEVVNPNTNTTEAVNQITPSNTNTKPESAEPGSKADYKDGTYTSTGTYTSPAGKESIKITLTLENDIIKSAKFVGEATNKASVYNQGKFGEGFQGAVVGKDIDTLNLTVVNGASLTTNGWNDALAKIKVEARVFEVIN